MTRNLSRENSARRSWRRSSHGSRAGDWRKPCKLTATKTRLPSPLYVICDADVCRRAGWQIVDFAAACLDGGARFLQIRAKHLTGREFLDATEAIVQRAEPFGAVVIVNDRADIARLGGAAGVHVGQQDLTPSQIRGIVGAAAVVGLSTHTEGEFGAALNEPVNYVAVGPVFETATKETGRSPIGLERVSAAAEPAARMSMPLVAIGGITLDRAPSVIQAGARAVAVISDLLATGDPRSRVREFLAVMEMNPSDEPRSALSKQAAKVAKRKK